MVNVLNGVDDVFNADEIVDEVVDIGVFGVVVLGVIGIIDVVVEITGEAVVLDSGVAVFVVFVVVAVVETPKDSG